jgi:hypothetical protein
MATVLQNGGYDGDSLYNTLKSIRDNFFWESHTYTHPVMDNLTYEASYAEFANNTQAALDLFDNDFSNPNYNNISVVTPSITGLFNSECLRAMYDLGIRNVVGDNSRKELIPDNVYHGIHTSVAVHGFAGIYIVPREDTNIYYDAGDTDDISTQYNTLYKTSLTFDEIVQLDVAVALRLLLNFRYDPYMFHQENMRTQSIGDKPITSLMTYWLDAVFDALLNYTTLPGMFISLILSSSPKLIFSRSDVTQAR